MKKQLGDLVKGTRLGNKWTQGQLAVKSKTKQETISRAEKNGCGIDLAEKLLKAMGYMIILDKISLDEEECQRCGYTKYATKNYVTTCESNGKTYQRHSFKK